MTKIILLVIFIFTSSFIRADEHSCYISVNINSVSLSDIVPGDNIKLNKAVTIIYNNEKTISCSLSENNIIFTNSVESFALPATLNSSCNTLTIGSNNSIIPDYISSNQTFYANLNIYAAYNEPCE